MRFKYLIAFIFVYSFISCSTDVIIQDDLFPEPTGPGTVTQSSFTADVDGEQFTALTSTATISSTTVPDPATSYIISGIEASGGIIVSVNTNSATIETGTYNYDDTDEIVIGIVYNLGTTAYNADDLLAEEGEDATISITSIDETNMLITGTFSGTLVNPEDSTDTVTITNGQFTNIPYM